MLSDVVELVKELKDVAKSSDGKKARDFLSGGSRDGNIHAKARDSIMQFPVLVSDSVSRAALGIVNKALEAEYANLIRLAIGMNDVVDLSTPDAKRKYLSQFHTNIGFNRSGSGAATQVIDDGNAMIDYLKENFHIINQENLTTLEEDLRSESLNDLTISARLSEALDKKDKEFIKKQMTNSKDPKGAKSQITATDVKKANEMVPTILELEVEYKVGDSLKSTQLLVGVQCVSHLVESDEMKYFVGRSVKENNVIFRAIQWTTGEIKFFKDFVFSIDRIKDEAGAQKNSSSRWWGKLRYLSTSNRFRAFFGKTKFIPNTTMVMSMAEIENMKNTQGLDMMDGGKVASLMDVYFLLGFVVVDEIDEIVYFFDEQTRQFRSYSFDALKKEIKDSNSSDLKALISLVGR